MGKNEFCDGSSQKTIVQVYQHESSYQEITKALKVSKTINCQAVQYFRTHATAEKVPRKQRCRITAVSEDALIFGESKKNPHKTANEIRIVVFGENGAKPSVDTQ